MMISTKGRYALRVMIELALRREEGFLALNEIAGRQQISEKYLEAIMKLLVREGLVVGVRGKKGGYRLAQEPEECTVASILRAAEGSLAPVACLEAGTEPCPRSGSCITLPMWQELYQLIDTFFEGKTLAQLVAQERTALCRE